ncbi:hypothetical protein FOZ63_008942, partial [Perkinsus olseni]
EFDSSAIIRPIVTAVLEDISDVYDFALVALEDDKDGSISGNCRVYMLDILAKCVGYDSLRGHHLLELTSGSLSSVVSLLSFVLRCDSGVADFELQACASRCLVELSYPECVFCREAAEMDGNATDIKKLTRKFNEHVSELICSVIEYDVVDSFGRCVCQHQRSHANTDILMKDFMTLIHNCLLYCSSHHHQLRQHLAIKSNIIPDILLPYIENILPVFTEVGSTVGAKSIEWANLTSALQTLAIVTFNVKTFRKPVAINCNYGTSQHWDAFAEASGVAIEGMQEAAPIDLDSLGGDEPPGEQRGGKKNGVWLTKVRRPSGDYKSRRRGRRRWKRGNPFKRVSRVMELEDTDEELSPVRRDLLTLLILPAVEKHSFAETLDPTMQASKRDTRLKMGVRNELLTSRIAASPSSRVSVILWTEYIFNIMLQRAKERTTQTGNPRLSFALSLQLLHQTANAKASRLQDLMTPRKPTPVKPRCQFGEVGFMAQVRYCALTGCLMRDPVKTPQGVLYERSAITDWLTSGNSTCPVSGQGLAVSDLSAAPEVLDATVGCQAEALAEFTADQKSGGGGENTLPSNETTQDGNGEEVNRSLLGDLPTLESGKQGLPSNPDKSSQVKQALRIRRTSQKLVNAPAELKCALDGKIMTNPVRSPYGHVFEKKTLEKWFDSCGEVCPITEKPLSIDDCKYAFCDYCGP